MRRAHTDTIRAAIVCGLWWAAPAAAQDGVFDRVAVDSIAAVDGSVDEFGDGATGVVIDAVASAALGGGFEAIVRPWMQKLGNSDEWNRQIWIGTLRYQHVGAVRLRVDGGLIGSPVGLGNLLLRPNMNPTISLPASLFVPLPSPTPGSPRATLLGVMYPFGVSAAASGDTWDLRAAVIDSSPLRMRRVFAQTNPPRFANVVVGGGVTPIVGVRIGASVTHGGWQRAGEQPNVTEMLDATIVTLESEVAFRHTKVIGEIVRNSVETPSGAATPSGWFVQGQQTLSPRWFAAGRVERMTAPLGLPDGTRETRHFTGSEFVVGYRLSPELTVRAGHRARRAFGADDTRHSGAASLVWWRRWK